MEAVEREQDRMAKSETAKRIKGVTVGWGHAISGGFR